MNPLSTLRSRVETASSPVGLDSRKALSYTHELARWITVCALALAMAFTSGANAQQLTLVDRVEGVSRVWMEAHYNFVYFDQVPDLDWDQAYRDTLSRVSLLDDDRAYYRELERFMARLHDGHSNVFLPQRLLDSAGVSPLKIAPIDGHPVVYRVAADLADQIPIGSVITAVNGLPTEEHVERHVRPFICASSPQQLHHMSLGDRLITGQSGEAVRLGIRTPAHDLRTVELTLRPREVPIVFVPDHAQTQPYEFRMLEDGIAYLRVDTFADGAGLQAAVGGHLPDFLAARGVIIDLRNNGGGDTSVAGFIAGLLADHPLHGAAWRTSEHRAAELAWSVFAKEDTERHRYALERGGWHREPATVWQHNPDFHTSAPVIVLTDWRTASAAEDFLVIIDELPQVTKVGRRTFGSSGQPLYFSLPGGGTARICAKRDTYPDGRDFVGTGVIPDFEVPLSLEELTGSIDATLERGLEHLRSQLTAP